MSQPQPFCPGPVNFTCVGTEIGPSFFWVVNSDRVVNYAFRSTDTFPLPLDVIMLDGVEAEVSRASVDQDGLVSITSVLRVNNISVLNGATLRCEDVTPRASETINVLTICELYCVRLLCWYSHAFSPAPPPFFNASFLLPSPGSDNISLQWSPSFISQYAVERYRVSVNPDPSSCSSDQVSPSEDYSCSGLVLGTRYTFTVSATNCGDQEGEREPFVISLCGACYSYISCVLQYVTSGIDSCTLLFS